MMMMVRRESLPAACLVANAAQAAIDLQYVQLFISLRFQTVASPSQELLNQYSACLYLLISIACGDSKY